MIIIILSKVEIRNFGIWYETCNNYRNSGIIQMKKAKRKSGRLQKGEKKGRELQRVKKYKRKQQEKKKGKKK